MPLLCVSKGFLTNRLGAQRRGCLRVSSGILVGFRLGKLKFVFLEFEVARFLCKRHGYRVLRVKRTDESSGSARRVGVHQRVQREF